MAYRIAGLDPEQFSEYFLMSSETLVEECAERHVATAQSRFPCRVSLRDAEEGDDVVLVNFTSHDVNTPYRHGFAIFVRDGVERAEFVDECPPVFMNRPIALRAFSEDGRLLDARLALHNDADEKVRELFDNPAIAYLDAHNAAHGCFSARVERYDG